MKVSVEPAGRDRYWNELRDMDPKDVCRRALVSFRDECYRVPFLNEEFLVDAKSQTVTPAGNTGKETDCSLLSLLYLLRSREIPTEGKWISEKGLRGGELFFRGPHALPTEQLADQFGDDRIGFLNSAANIGGKSVNFGDAGAEFLVLPRIPLVCVLWTLDDEFPAQINYLFDATTSDQLPLDMILDMVNRVGDRLTADYAPDSIH